MGKKVCEKLKSLKQRYGEFTQANGDIDLWNSLNNFVIEYDPIIAAEKAFSLLTSS